ncbi:hypothetical protein [Eudoraea chungangensis]|uniref:hypothetical protein n=1 Tax=Eudoraea chungangensis TaxID=1481905 RepID=UPI0023EAFAC2|nr:hypothetical protein [Eudoraea chungangensis]
MKMILSPNKYLLVICVVLCCINFASGQLIPKTPEEKKAVELVKAYQAELGMTVEQAASMYNSINDNLVLSKEIMASAASEEEKKKSLAKLREQETAFMGSILEPKQFKEYKKLRKTLQ